MMFHKKSDLTISFILQCDVGFFYDEPCKITKIYLIMKIIIICLTFFKFEVHVTLVERFCTIFLCWGYIPQICLEQ